MSIGAAIQLRSGALWHVQDPSQSTVRITDIAWALSNLCRFGGHCRKFYSVAEHSVIVSHLVPKEHALCGLMHDATEALGLVDLPRPVKDLVPGYRALEMLNWQRLAELFDLPRVIPQCVHDADNAVLMAEKHHLMASSAGVWPSVAPAPVNIIGLVPDFAYDTFLHRWNVLTGRLPTLHVDHHSV